MQSQTNITKLEEQLSQPDQKTKEIINSLDGDIIVLGAGGKMGPTLSMMLKRSAPSKKIYAASRFTDSEVEAHIKSYGIETIKCDLLDKNSYKNLPLVENVYYLVGMKFGSSENQPLTWAMNAYIPSLVADYFKKSKIIILSTGNVYPFTDIRTGGATEQTLPDPIGEYAQSCLARERIFQYFSETHQTPMTIIRLNYSNEPRYGIIVDLALKILNDELIDLTTGYVNLIWQRDANSYIARSIILAKSPPEILNVTGPETVSVHQLAILIGNLLNKTPKFTNSPAQDALLSNASKCFKIFGYPQTTLLEMTEQIVSWLKSGGKLLGKETKFQVRNGKF